MDIDIKRLKAGCDEYTLIDINHSFSKEELENTSILELNNISIVGNLYIEHESIGCNLIIKGKMVIPCSISLKPVDYQFEIEINDIIVEIDEKNTNTIDILPIVWENILMEIPIKVTSSDLSGVKTSGDGWELITQINEKEVA